VHWCFKTDLGFVHGKGFYMR